MITTKQPGNKQMLANTARQVRRDIVRMVHACQSGHPGGSLGCADLLTALYFEVMKIKEEAGTDGFLEFFPQGHYEDLFFYPTGISHPYYMLSLQGEAILRSRNCQPSE